MARRGLPLIALCTLLSFAYIHESLEKHWLAEHPRLSSALTLLLSGFFCSVLSFFTRLIPGAEDRIVYDTHQSEDNVGLLSTSSPLESKFKDTRPPLPERPDQLSLPILVVLIVVRLESLHAVNLQRQCATTGIEPFLPFVLYVWDIFTTRRRWVGPDPLDPDDPWRNIFDDIREWFTGPRVSMSLTGVAIFFISLSTSMASGYKTPSGYACLHPIDSRTSVVSLQFLGLALDATICVCLWRLLVWSRSAKQRIRSSGLVLVCSGLAMAVVSLIAALWASNQETLDFGSWSLFETVVDGFAFAVFVASGVWWMCETSTPVPATIITMCLGVWSSGYLTLYYGDWIRYSLSGAYFPLWFITFASILYIRYQAAIGKFFMVVLIGTTFIATFRASIRGRDAFPRHPLSDLIYKANIESDRYRARVSTSKSLHVALTTYEELHPGTAAPPNFAEWYSQAQGTFVIDDFAQIDTDLAPFWNMSPDTLRKGATILTSVPGVHTITIKDGQVTHSDAGDEGQNRDLLDLVQLIERFSVHLPDMVLPVNLGSAPRILPSWETAHSQSTAEHISSGHIRYRENVAAKDYRRMQWAACPEDSAARRNVAWKNEELCEDCVKEHSKGPIIYDRDKSFETCSQPDLGYLHEFYMTNPKLAPIQELLPLFGFAKTESFRDILIPLPRVMQDEEPDITWGFGRRFDSLFYMGDLGKELKSSQILRGSSKYRLLELLAGNHASGDVATLLVGEPLADFRYERVKVSEANSVGPLKVGLKGGDKCEGDYCKLAKQLYGTDDEEAEPLEYRYIVVLDEADGPSKQFMRTLRSGSVPFVSTIFRTWYTERLQPWLHYVPIDPRFQSLHTTYLFFTGTEDRQTINGVDTNMQARTKDGEYIAQQGQKWADQVLQQKDMEVYLFRLLLEWGRLIDDNRELIGFRKTDEGKLDNIGFSQGTVS
ncbi:unnamed protein product [Clonostachys rosea]|uniref:Glycosyl transferase CAP10 domain-containing protein n=1 Tax=Bionectria ochroleuca TaxID=29856 RepID=A0ABY6UJ28_BIOOC|nr:unnamed protein product [Clonostachys rosea]